MYLILKTLMTALLVVGISECGKKFSLFGGILASLPLASILAFVWLYQDTRDVARVIELSYLIFWMVIPSLFFFICFPYFLKIGWNFYSSLMASSALMAIIYSLYVLLIKKFGVKL